METIAEAKQFLRANWEKGEKCPCCSQLVKLYRYKFNSYMAVVLKDIFIHQLAGSEDWVHVIQKIRPVNGDYAKLRHWGLLEEKGDQPEPEKKASGFWRVTNKGKQFLYNRVEIQKYALLFDNRCFGFSGPQINIQIAFGNKFNYTELMQFLPKEEELNNQQIAFI